MNEPIRFPVHHQHIAARRPEALEAIERLADMGCRGRDPVAALKAIRETALVALGRPLVVPEPPPKRMRVRVTACESATDWYSGSIGSEFEVVEWGRGYVLACDYDRGYEAAWFSIRKQDAEVVR